MKWEVSFLIYHEKLLLCELTLGSTKFCTSPIDESFKAKTVTKRFPQIIGKLITTIYNSGDWKTWRDLSVLNLVHRLFPTFLLIYIIFSHSLLYWQGMFFRCPPLIFLSFKHVIEYKKLRDTCFFLSAQNKF